MKIEITDSKVVLDGVTYRKEETLPSEPKFDTPCWVIVGSAPIPQPIYAIEQTGNELRSGEATYVPADKARLCTLGEIESYLIKEANKRGLTTGVKIVTAMGTSINISKGNYWYNPGHDALYTSDGMTLYDRGQWATIIPDKKPLPKTREEFVSFLEDYSFSDTANTPGVPIYGFLDQYDFND